MRLLHTSDWHIGRTFHGHSTMAHLGQVLDAMTAAVAENAVDVVLVAGDVFDSSTPRAEAFSLLNRVLVAMREAGAQIVLTSGNHDGPARLGHMSDFAALGGVHVRTDPARLAEPVELHDETGPVHCYAIPYLHPALLAVSFPEFTGTSHAEAIAFAMERIRADHAVRGGRWVVISHAFVQDVGGSQRAEVTLEESGASEERDITRGGIDLVPLGHLRGPDYVALGHLHARVTFPGTARYSGAPLRYSFGERDRPRGAWLVDLGPSGPAQVSWLDLPTPRPVARLTGTLAELLAADQHGEHVDSWVDAVLTDQVMPLDAMRRLQVRFPHAVTLTHRPQLVAQDAPATYAERVRGRSELEIVDGFLAHVRHGVGASPAEQGLVQDALTELTMAELSQ